MKIPDEALTTAAEVIVFDVMGRQLWRKTVSENDRFSLSWRAWARHTVQNAKRKPRKDSNGHWGRWAESVAVGNRNRNVLKGPRFRKAGAHSKSQSRGWVQAASRMATIARRSHARLQAIQRDPWALWAETVGSNAAKTKGGRYARHKEEHST